MEALADRLQAGLAHRRVLVEDEHVGERLAAELVPRGWRSEPLLLLGRDGAGGLYERLGFRRLTLQYRFTRAVG